MYFFLKNAQRYDFTFFVRKWYETEQNEIVTLKIRYDLPLFARNSSGTAPNESIALKSLHDSHGKAYRLRTKLRAAFTHIK